MKQYVVPWDTHRMGTAHYIEERLAHRRFLKLPPTAPVADYDEAVAGLHPQAKAAMVQEGAKAVLAWDAMLASHCPTGPNDGERVADAMRKGFYEYLFLLGGRAGGKSHEVAEAIVEVCSEKRKRVVCGREFMASIRESSRALLVSKINSHPSAAEWTITDTELRHANGTLITFIGMARNPESAKSLEGADIFWGEEAQTFSAHSVEILLPTIREQGSMLIFTANPRYADDPVPRMAMVPAEVPEAAWIKWVQFEDNPYIFTSRLMNDLRKAYLRSKRFKHVWRGDLDRNSELRIIQHHVGRPPMPAGHYPTPRTLYGIDFGGTDPTALVRLNVFSATQMGRDKDDRGVIFIDREFYQPCKSNREIVKGVTATCPELLDGYHELKADSADPKAIGELNIAGVPTRGAEKGPGSVEAGLRTLADFDIWISEECPNVILCAENYRWKSDRTGKALNVPEHNFSHPWDAARYAVEGEDLTSGQRLDYIILEEFNLDEVLQ